MLFIETGIYALNANLLSQFFYITYIPMSNSQRICFLPFIILFLVVLEIDKFLFVYILKNIVTRYNNLCSKKLVVILLAFYEQLKYYG